LHIFAAIPISIAYDDTKFIRHLVLLRWLNPPIIIGLIAVVSSLFWCCHAVYKHSNRNCKWSCTGLFSLIQRIMECYERCFRRCSTARMQYCDGFFSWRKSHEIVVPPCSKICMAHLPCAVWSMSAVAVPKDIRQKFIATASPVMYVQYDIVFAVWYRVWLSLARASLALQSTESGTCDRPLHQSCYTDVI